MGTKDKFEAYVHKFGGYALKDAKWMEESDKFKVLLSEEKVEDLDEIDFSKFLIAGYDSPMKFWNRRNEILFTIKDVADGVIYNNTEDALNSFSDQSESFKDAVSDFDAFHKDKDLISMNVADEESFDEQQVESKEVEKPDFKLIHLHDFNSTENDIDDGTNLNLFPVETFDFSRSEINDPEASDHLGDHGMDDLKIVENKVKDQTDEAIDESIEKQ